MSSIFQERGKDLPSKRNTVGKGLGNGEFATFQLSDTAELANSNVNLIIMFMVLSLVI